MFYPPWTYDESNSQNVAFGTDRINLDASQGTGAWPTKVTVPGISGKVSAVHYPNSNLIYAGTSSGQVYRLVKSGGAWMATAIHATPLASRWIWDVSTLPGDTDTVVLVMAGFGSSHVWRGALVMGSATFAWTDISGTAPNDVPDVPANSLCIDPLNATHYYVGTDIGVFRTTDGGTTWQQFSDGLPNTAVYDLWLHEPTRLLRAATHGRGLWERKLDIATEPSVNLYVRDHLMSTSRILPAPSPVTATWEDPLHHVSLGQNLWWWQCADAKIDAPDLITHSYQMPVADVDYFALETQLEHRNPQRGVMNRIYVQVHNRGVSTANNVTVKILYADASPGLPNLPSDFWTAFPGDGTTTVWKPIGAAKVISSLSPKRPEVLEWDWVPPMSSASHSCLLIVVDCPDDPIPATNKVFDIGNLVKLEKRVGLKNLHVIDAPPAPFWFDLRIFGKMRGRDELVFEGLLPGWSFGLLFPADIARNLEFEGLRKAKLSRKRLKALIRHLRRDVKQSELQAFYTLSSPRKGAMVKGLPRVRKGFPLLLVCEARDNATAGSFTIIQRYKKRVFGGNTFVLRRAKDPEG